ASRLQYRVLRMARRRNKLPIISRRKFLKSMSLAPVVLKASPLRAFPFPSKLEPRSNVLTSPAFSDFRLTPHYPAKLPLDDSLRFLLPGSDEYVTEKYASEIASLFADWAKQLKISCPALSTIASLLDPRIEGSSLKSGHETVLRSGVGVQVLRSEFASEVVAGRERFLEAIRFYFAQFSRVETAEFEVVGIDRSLGESPLRVDVRYSFVGVVTDGSREQRIGTWTTQWLSDESGKWRIRRWEVSKEQVSRAPEPLFIEVSEHALGEIPSYRDQMLRGVDYWRTVLDSACGIDVYGNNGVAVGDFDND